MPLRWPGLLVVSDNDSRKTADGVRAQHGRVLDRHELRDLSFHISLDPQHDLRRFLKNLAAIRQITDLVAIIRDDPGAAAVKHGDIGQDRVRGGSLSPSDVLRVGVLFDLQRCCWRTGRCRREHIRKDTLVFVAGLASQFQDACVAGFAGGVIAIHHCDATLGEGLGLARI